MVEFIAKRILKEAKNSIEQGQAKFRSYFVKTKIYAEFKAGVITILTNEGFSDCIVTE